MQLFYNANITEDTQQFTFDKTESRHIVRVLRKKLAINYLLQTEKEFYLLLKLR